MASATQNLENDHIHILRLTDVMLTMVRKESSNVEHFETVINLIRKFADGLHHIKEEQMLFPMLEDHGFSTEQGPVAVMLEEHTQGRDFVKGMLNSLSAMQKGSANSVNELYSHASGYAELLQNHISKENNILFRMADDILSSDNQNSLLNRFIEAELQVDPEYNLESAKAKIEELATIYDVEFSTTLANLNHNMGCH